MPTIETDRLRLRPFTMDDLDDYHTQIYSDPDVTRFLPGGKPRPKEGTQVVLEFSIKHGWEHGFTLWALVRKADNQFLGHCGLIFIHDTQVVELAYAIGKAFWGQGYTTEAGHASLRYGFEIAHLEHIIALAEMANLASQRVMQKIGMKHQGTTYQYYDTELELYTMAREDFVPGAAPYTLIED
jgi:ribosomal-protein-alanine N-acetyltransferase